MTDEPVPVEPEAEPAPEAGIEPGPLEPSTPEEVEKAEQLIRQARLATMRKQSSVARKLLDEAIETAPRSVPVLEAIGVSAELAKAAVLISPGKDTTVDEVDRFVVVFAKAVQRLREMSPGWEGLQSVPTSGSPKPGGHAK